MGETPLPNLKKISDPLDRYVASLPFSRMQVSTYCNEVSKAFEDPQASVENLRSELLKAPAFAQFDEEEIERLFEALLAVKKSDDVNVSPCISFQLLGILWCVGSAKEKARCLSEIVNSQEIGSISSNGESMKESLQLMFFLASQFTVERSLKTQDKKFRPSESHQILFERLAPEGIDCSKVLEALIFGEPEDKDEEKIGAMKCIFGPTSLSATDSDADELTCKDFIERCSTE